MVIFRKACCITRINFQRWKGDQRIWIIFTFIAVLLVKEVSGLTAYGLESGEWCTAYLLPVIFHARNISTGIIKTMLYLGCLFLLCDAPFIYQSTPYMVLRSRRESWWLGECLYILVVTFIYIAFITVVTTLTIIPVATFGDSWGGVIQDFAFGNSQMYAKELASVYDLNLAIPAETIGYLYPSGAQVYTFLTVWASFFLLGLLQYFVSLASKSMFLGSVVTAVFIFLDPLFNEWSVSFSFRWTQMLSPVCWVSTDNLKLVDAKNFLTIPYVVVMFVLLIVLLVWVIRMASKKIMIEVRGEV